jgi:hypothetical protein
MVDADGPGARGRWPAVMEQMVRGEGEGEGSPSRLRVPESPPFSPLVPCEL